MHNIFCHLNHQHWLHQKGGFDQWELYLTKSFYGKKWKTKSFISIADPRPRGPAIFSASNNLSNSALITLVLSSKGWVGSTRIFIYPSRAMKRKYLISIVSSSFYVWPNCEIWNTDLLLIISKTALSFLTIVDQQVTCNININCQHLVI